MLHLLARGDGWRSHPSFGRVVPQHEIDATHAIGGPPQDADASAATLTDQQITR